MKNTPKEIADAILKALGKEDAPEGVLIELLLKKWENDIIKAII